MNFIYGTMTITITEQDYQDLLRVKREYDELRIKIKEYFKNHCVVFKTRKLPQEIMELINE